MSGVTAVTTMEKTKPTKIQNSSKRNSTDIELKILTALRSLVPGLRDKADCFTFVSVRRLLEEDMGLDKYALDVHKSFVKKHLVQCLEDTSNDGALQNAQENERKDDGGPTKTQEREEAENISKTVAEDMKGEGNKEALMANSEKVAMASLRRLYLKLEKHSLDPNPFKKFIDKELDEVLQIPDSPKRGADLKKKVESTPSKNLDSEENSEGTERKDNDGGPTETQSEEHDEAENVSKTVAEYMKVEGNKEALLRDIGKALQKRASYIQANSEKLTMGLLRRRLEEDLKLEKHSLDLEPFKKFIDKELDEVVVFPDSPKHVADLKEKVKSTPAKQLDSEENPDSDAEDVAVMKATIPTRGADLKKKVKSTPSMKLDSEENSDSDAEDDEEVAVKKTFTPKRKRETAALVSSLKKAKHAATDSDNDSDAGDNEFMEYNGHYQSSSEKPLKQTKETATAAFGKRVKHLKSVIKSCGMSIPPTIYRKAKQVAEDKRQATLIKELGQILAKEGLSSDPSEKEIKEVKKRKNIAKELEGIDASNIVSSSRRRFTTSFAPPPKPKITEASDSESDESDNGKDNKEEEGSQSETE